MTNSSEISLQKRYAPHSICFGCGPANPDGLHIESYVQGETLICYFQPLPHHHAFPNVLNGGIIGTLLDCHCNWTAAWFLMQHHGLSQPPCTVTAEYSIQLLRPTPMEEPLQIVAWLKDIKDQKATTQGEIRIADKVYDRCTGTFVAVNKGHPAFHRWSD